MSQTSSQLVGIVPAAGLGTRLYPYPHPKEMLPVGSQQIEVGSRIEERPKVVSQYLIEGMIASGARRLFVILGSGKCQIMEYYGSGEALGVDIAYLYQDRLQGMPFAINLVYPWLQGNETVLMGMPDTIIEPPTATAKLLQAHKAWSADLTLGLFRTQTPDRFGMIGIDEGSNVTQHVDKPAETNLEWLWGMACWEMRFMELMHTALAEGLDEPAELVLGRFFDLALDQGLRVKGLRFEDGRYTDVGTYDDFRRALELYG